MGRCGCGWLDQARELEGGVRVASGEMEGIFACEGALARDVLVIIDLLLVLVCGKANCGYGLVLLSGFCCQDGIGLLPMTKPQNLEMRDVTCVGFSQATSEGNAQEPNHSGHIFYSSH